MSCIFCSVSSTETTAPAVVDLLLIQNHICVECSSFHVVLVSAWVIVYQSGRHVVH